MCAVLKTMAVFQCHAARLLVWATVGRVLGGNSQRACPRPTRGVDREGLDCYKRASRRTRPTIVSGVLGLLLLAANAHFVAASSSVDRSSQAAAQIAGTRQAAHAAHDARGPNSGVQVDVVGITPLEQGGSRVLILALRGQSDGPIQLSGSLQLNDMQGRPLRALKFERKTLLPGTTTNYSIPVTGPPLEPGQYQAHLVLNGEQLEVRHQGTIAIGGGAGQTEGAPFSASTASSPASDLVPAPPLIIEPVRRPSQDPTLPEARPVGPPDARGRIDRGASFAAFQASPTAESDYRHAARQGPAPSLDAQGNARRGALDPGPPAG